MCGPMVICGKCGNNCCNGGYGEILGEEVGEVLVCDMCPSAYDLQAKGDELTGQAEKYDGPVPALNPSRYWERR